MKTKAIKTTALHPWDVADLADRLGALKATKAELEAEEKTIKARLLAAGIREGEGRLFRFTLVNSVRTLIDYKAVLDVLKPSRQLLTAHTRYQDQESLRVVARTGEDIKAA